MVQGHVQCRMLGQDAAADIKAPQAACTAAQCCRQAHHRRGPSLSTSPTPAADGGNGERAVLTRGSAHIPFITLTSSLHPAPLCPFAGPSRLCPCPCAAPQPPAHASPAHLGVGRVEEEAHGVVLLQQVVLVVVLGVHGVLVGHEKVLAVAVRVAVGAAAPPRSPRHRRPLPPPPLAQLAGRRRCMLSEGMLRCRGVLQGRWARPGRKAGGHVAGGGGQGLLASADERAQAMGQQKTADGAMGEGQPDMLRAAPLELGGRSFSRSGGVRGIRRHSISGQDPAMEPDELSQLMPNLQSRARLQSSPGNTVALREYIKVRWRRRGALGRRCLRRQTTLQLGAAARSGALLCAPAGGGSGVRPTGGGRVARWGLAAHRRRPRRHSPPSPVRPLWPLQRGTSQHNTNLHTPAGAGGEAGQCARCHHCAPQAAHRRPAAEGRHGAPAAAPLLHHQVQVRICSSLRFQTLRCSA